jgi:hypothetical protein
MPQSNGGLPAASIAICNEIGSVGIIILGEMTRAERATQKFAIVRKTTIIRKTPNHFSVFSIAGNSYICLIII